MGTRSTIALERTDGTVCKIYCHWDGYLDHNGRILVEHWCDPQKMELLLDGGNLCTLGQDIGQTHPQDRPQYGTPEYDVYRQMYRSGCEFYGRDRGYTDHHAITYQNWDTYLRESTSQEYNYALRFTDRSWCWWVKYRATNGRWVPLQWAIELEAQEQEME